MATKGTIDKWKSKEWIEVLAPKLFNSKTIGYTIATDPRTVVGRVLKVDIGEITGESSMRQRTTMRFKIDKIVGSQAETKFLGYFIQQDQRRSIARKKNTKIYVNLKVKTRDEKEFRVKTNITTDMGAPRSTRTQVQKKYIQMLTDEAQAEKFSNLISDLIGNRFALKAKKELHKIYPIRQVLIEKVEIPEELVMNDEVAKLRQRREEFAAAAVQADGVKPAEEKKEAKPAEEGKKEEKTESKPAEEKKPEEKKEKKAKKEEPVKTEAVTVGQ